MIRRMFKGRGGGGRKKKSSLDVVSSSNRNVGGLLKDALGTRKKGSKIQMSCLRMPDGH